MVYLVLYLKIELKLNFYRFSIIRELINFLLFEFNSLMFCFRVFFSNNINIYFRNGLKWTTLQARWMLKIGGIISWSEFSIFHSHPISGKSYWTFVSTLFGKLIKSFLPSILSIFLLFLSRFSGWTIVLMWSLSQGINLLGLRKSSLIKTATSFSLLIWIAIIMMAWVWWSLSLKKWIICTLHFTLGQIMLLSTMSQASFRTSYHSISKIISSVRTFL